MHTTEITPLDIIGVLVSNGFVRDNDIADHIYCSIMNGCAAGDCTKQLQKPADFLKYQYAKSICLIASWEAALGVKNLSIDDIMFHVVRLVALYIHCTEDMDKEQLQAYNKEKTVKQLLTDPFDWKIVRRACVNMDTKVKGRHSYITIHAIRYCLAKLMHHVTNAPEMVPELQAQKQTVLDTIDAMFDDDSKKTIEPMK